MTSSSNSNRFECNECGLRKTCKWPVYGSGSGSIMFIGEAPGETEDNVSIPFSGLSGRILRKAVGNRNHYFTNAVKCRPPDNRKPTSSEIKACYHWLEEEIDTVKPSLIVFLGRTAYSLHTKIYDKYGIPYLFFYHPAWAMRTGNVKEWSSEIGDIIHSIDGDCGEKDI